MTVIAVNSWFLNLYCSYVCYKQLRESEWRLYESFVFYFLISLHYFQRKNFLNKTLLVPTLYVCAHMCICMQCVYVHTHNDMHKSFLYILIGRIQSQILTYCVSSRRFFRSWQIYQHNTSNAMRNNSHYSWVT